MHTLEDSHVQTQLWHPHQDRPEATRVRLNRGWAASLSPARTCTTHYTYIRQVLHVGETMKSIMPSANVPKNMVWWPRAAKTGKMIIQKTDLLS
uniref:Uncharacterized protein n=1 Tax=Trichogramma kaykai TaxID=54128 RepID=A0ABD2WYA7_9HYME